MQQLKVGQPHDGHQAVLLLLQLLVQIHAVPSRPGTQPHDGGAELPGCEPTGWLNDGDTIDLGGRTLEVIHTPGHSPGSVSFLDREARVLFPGDAVRTDYLLLMLDGSDPAVYRLTLERLVGMLDAVDTIYSAHNPPLVPDDVRRLREAYEIVWSGTVPSTPEQAPPQWQQPGVDVHIANGFTFLVPESSITSKR